MTIAEPLTPARLRALPSWLINQAAIAANRLTDQALAGVGLRRHHYAILAALAEFGPSSQAHLGRCTGVDRSDVVAAINTLEERRYVERSPDPADGRRNVVTLTAAGSAHLERLDALVAGAQDDLLASWSRGERDGLISQLTRILDGRPADRGADRGAASMLRLVTIGAYGFDGESFVRRLRGADVRLLLDVRQRRGVRGPEYAWANSRRLQAALAQARIAYEHHPELAPTTELRQLQYAEDDRQGVGKRSRRALADEYARRYTTEILDRADLAPVVSALSSGEVAALFCVERDPQACHRSLIAQRLAERHGVAIEHLRPS